MATPLFPIWSFGLSSYKHSAEYTIHNGPASLRRFYGHARPPAPSLFAYTALSLQTRVDCGADVAIVLFLTFLADPG